MRSTLIAGVIAIATTPAIAGTLDATATSSGTRIDITLANRSRGDIELDTTTQAGFVQHAGLTIALDGPSPRTLVFVDPRAGKRHKIDTTIAAGASLVQSVDVQRYAIVYDNGGPLPPGNYTATIRWELPCDHCGVVTATTKVAIVAPVEKRCTESPPAKIGLAMLARIDGSVLEVGIHNVDARVHCIAGYIHTFEQQSDWLTLTIDSTQTMQFWRGRDKSALVTIELAPGATAWTRWDLPAWAKLDGVALKNGPHRSRLVYDATRERDLWNGVLEQNDAWLLP